MSLNKSAYIYSISAILVLVLLYITAYQLYQPSVPISKDSVISIAIPLVQASTSPVTKVNTVVAVPSNVPTNIRIPSISVDTYVESVGLTSSGAVGIPKNSMNVAWYNGSPLPGQTGISIMDGHYTWKIGYKAVFEHLSNLKAGDKIYVKNGFGSTTVFVVTKLVLYGENDNDPKIFISSDEKPHLNLITCGGVWNKIKKSYSDRLVVFSDLASSY